MIDLWAIRERIDALSLFNAVERITDAAQALRDEAIAPPIAFVSTGTERAGPNRLSTGRHRQLVVQTVSVLWVQGSESAARQAEDQVEEFRAAIIASLIGWQPAGADMPLSYVSYSIRLIEAGLVWPELIFSAPYILSKAV